jgi:polysaccharide biosynthesis protein PelD
MMIGLGLLGAIDLLFLRDDVDSRYASLHPFWLIVVLIAVRYGALPGYVAGALSALVYLAIAVLRAGSLPQADILSAQVLLNPVLFVLVAGALGELQESGKRAYRSLVAKYEEVEAGMQDLAQRYLASRELNTELERRIAIQTSTVTTLYKAAKSLENLDMQILSPSVLELTVSFVEVEACALYLRRDGRFMLEEARPANVDFDRPQELGTTQGLLAIVLGERRTATVRDVMAEATPAQIMSQRLLMATPLLSEDSEVMGILIVERMPFLRFTPAAVKLFALLGDWASSAFQRALRFQQTLDRNIEDEITGAYNYFYVVKRLGEEIERFRRYGIPLTLVALGIKDYGEILPVKLTSVLHTLNLTFGPQMRTFDILGKYVTDGMFLLVLPHTTMHQAQTVAEWFKREIDALEIKPFDDDCNLEVNVGVASVSKDVTGPELLIEEAVRALHAGNRLDR